VPVAVGVLLAVSGCGGDDSAAQPATGGTSSVGGAAGGGGAGGAGGAAGSAGATGTCDGSLGGAAAGDLALPPLTGVIHGHNQGPDGYCPYQTPCADPTPVCTQGGVGWAAQCAACPGTGGPAMVSVGDACVDSTEVTRAQYAAWLATSPATSGQSAECAWNADFAPDATCVAKPEVCANGCDAHPQACVDWCDATAYCASVGKRLCSEYPSWITPSTAWAEPDQTELVRACDQGTGESHPYGSAYDATACNGAGQAKNTTLATASLSACKRTFPGGDIFDLEGNVAEWEDACDGATGATDKCRTRGGSYADSASALGCLATDASLQRDATSPEVGFRCCGP
jgi:Sulfatase-modifying factor enzyme 1